MQRPFTTSEEADIFCFHQGPHYFIGMEREDCILVYHKSSSSISRLWAIDDNLYAVYNGKSQAEDLFTTDSLQTAIEEAIKIL